MTNPADEHLRLIDERAYEVVANVLRYLETQRIDYVLAGGWAVFAYGSPIPSVDTDVFLASTRAGDVTRRIARDLGVTTGPGGQFEALSLDQPNCILGPDTELGEPDRCYVPGQLLARNTVRRDLALPSGTLAATVPGAAALAFMKLKAYHDRELAWRATRDASVMATIPPTQRPEIRAKTEAYYFRKAGKDLFDIAWLATRHTSTAEALAIASEFEMAADLQRPLRAIPPPLRTFALGLAQQDEAAIASWLSDPLRAQR